MSLLYRHIIKTISLSTLLVAIVMMGIIFFINLLGELKNIGVGEYTLWQAIIYVLLQLPHELYQFFPILALLGGIAGLSILSAQNELILMRASGFSTFQMLKAALISSLILMIFMLMVGEWLAPTASYMAALRRETAKAGGQAVVTGSGVWIHEGNMFLHVRQVIDRSRLEEVTGYVFDTDHHLKTSFFAKQLDRKNEKQWKMHDVIKTTFTAERVFSQRSDEAVLEIKLNPSLLNMGLIEPNEMSLRRLAMFSRYLVRNGLEAGAYQFEFWSRIFQPFMSFVMILLAVPFVLRTSVRTSMGWQLMCGIMLGFLFYICNSLLGQMSIIFQSPPWLAALLPSLLFAGISAFLLKSL